MSDHLVNPDDDSNKSQTPPEAAVAAGFSPADLAEITTGFDDAVLTVSSLEPIRRDAERSLRDLLGASPDPSGRWINVTKSKDGEYGLQFTITDRQLWLRLSTALQKINEIVSLREIQKSLPAYSNRPATTSPSDGYDRSRSEVHLVERYGRKFRNGGK